MDLNFITRDELDYSSLTGRRLKYHEKLLDLVHSKNGKLLSLYEKAKVKAYIECNFGHTFHTSPDNIRKENGVRYVLEIIH